MITLLVNTLIFFAVFFAVVAVNAVLIDIHSSERKRLKERLEQQQRERQLERARVLDFDQVVSGARNEIGATVPLRQWLSFVLEQSGLEFSLRRLIQLMVGLALVSGVVVGAVFRNPFAGVAIGAICGSAPLIYVHLVRRRRLEQLRAQLPDAFDLMSRVVRAGQTITQAMRAVADEFSQPISLEFLYCYEQMNLGLSPEEALRKLARRTGLLEIKIFVLAVVVHRQTGGNLAELLDKLAFVVRDRFRIQGKINSLTAQGRMQAGILLALPPGMFVLLMIVDPKYEVLLLQYPLMIVAALAMMATGAVWIRRIVNFDF